MEKLKGLIAAPHTPFCKDGSVNLKMIPKMAEHLIRESVTGVYISGSTGEGFSCTVAERIAVMDAWHSASQGKLKLIVHVGALAMGDIEVLAQHAESLQVFAISVVPSCYFKPPTIEMLVEYCRKAASFAPHTPFYYYHTGASGVTFSMTEFLRKADGVIPTLAGIKFNSTDLYEYQNCRHVLNGKYDIVYGVDEFFAGALALGAKGFIGSTYNYASDIYFKIWDAFNEGRLEEVEAGMAKVCAIVDLLVEYGGFAAGKAMMMRHGLDMGGVRLPLRSLTDKERSTILETLKKIVKD